MKYCTTLRNLGSYAYSVCIGISRGNIANFVLFSIFSSNVFLRGFYMHMRGSYNFSESLGELDRAQHQQEDTQDIFLLTMMDRGHDCETILERSSVA